jgi:transcription elongation factor S-II
MMGRLRQNTNKDISRMASDIVAKWKKQVEQEKAARKGGDPAKGTEASPKPSPSPAPKPLAGNKRKYEGNIEKRHFKTDKIDIGRTGNTQRDNCIGVLYNGLAFRSTDSEDHVLQRAIEVENAVYKLFGGVGDPYQKKVLALFSNLKNKQNALLRSQVLGGEVTADKLVNMTAEQLMSEAQRKQDEEMEKENIKKAQAPMVEKSISDSLQCGNCKQKKVSYTQAQTRSADEPMTTFCECMNCGKRWKVRLFFVFCPYACGSLIAEC